MSWGFLVIFDLGNGGGRGRKRAVSEAGGGQW